MARSGRRGELAPKARVEPIVSGTQHGKNKGFADNSALKEEHDPIFRLALADTIL